MDEKVKENNLLKIIILLIILLAIIIVGIAFAKYLTSITGGAKPEIAVWHFDITNGTKQDTGIIEFAMTRTDGNTEVAEGKIAPGTSGEFRIEIDTTGTEVSLKYDIKINLNECPKNLVFYKAKNLTEKISDDANTDSIPREALSKFENKLLISRYLPLEKASRKIYRNNILGMVFRYRNNTNTNRPK